MQTGIVLGIAQAVFRIELPSGELAANLCKSWAAFVSPSPPDSTIEVEIDGQLQQGLSQMPDIEALADGAARIWGPGFEALADADRRRARLRQAEGRFPINSVLKMLLAERLLLRGGLLLHSVAVALGGQAACFAGKSGAGKSTLGGLCSRGGLSLLADELVALVPEAGGFTAHGTPWNLGAPAHARLCAVGSLGWADSSRLEAAPPVELLRLVLSNCVLPDPSPEGRARLFRAASELVAKVPVVKLNFCRDASAAAAVRDALSVR